MIGSLIRRIVFWTIDFIKGRKIRKHYKEIKKEIETPNLNKQEKKIEELLNHAKNTTEFYKNIKFKNIKDFPVVNKLIYNENYEKFQSSEYINKKIHKMSTSGSTGTPFVVRQNMNKRYRNLADIIYFNKITGQKIGDKYIFFRVWNDKNKKSKLEKWKQNLIPIDILHLDDSSLEKIRNFIKKNKKINSTLGYANTYKMLVNYLEKNNDTKEMFRIKTMYSSSEVLDLNTKKKIKKIIGADVIDRYSNQENGILAQSRPNGDEFYINTASYYVELLNLNNDKEAKDGELARIVITDLYNYAMPIIRYDTGDLAIKQKNSKRNSKTQVIKNIQGRRVDMFYDTKGNIMTPHTMGVTMWKFNKIKQYQFIQETKNKYRLKLNTEKGVYTEKEIIDTLKQILGADAIISIEYVKEIPVISSGKYKETICNYKPDNKK